MKYYCLMDGRYVLDPDRALVNETCDTLEEAAQEMVEHMQVNREQKQQQQPPRRSWWSG